MKPTVFEVQVLPRASSRFITSVPPCHALASCWAPTSPFCSLVPALILVLGLSPWALRPCGPVHRLTGYTTAPWDLAASDCTSEANHRQVMRTLLRITRRLAHFP